MISKDQNWRRPCFAHTCHSCQNKAWQVCLESAVSKIYEGHTISFQTFFVGAFKIVVESWKFTMLLLYILWHDRPIFMISRFNEQLQKQLEYILPKPDCHSWWISKIVFKTWKKCHWNNVWNASDCFSTILHKSSISFRVA